MIGGGTLCVWFTSTLGCLYQEGDSGGRMLGGSIRLPGLLPAWHHIMPAWLPSPGRKLREGVGGGASTALGSHPWPFLQGTFLGMGEGHVDWAGG